MYFFCGLPNRSHVTNAGGQLVDKNPALGLGRHALPTKLLALSPERHALAPERKVLSAERRGLSQQRLLVVQPWPPVPPSAS